MFFFFFFFNYQSSIYSLWQELGGLTLGRAGQLLAFQSLGQAVTFLLGVLGVGTYSPAQSRFVPAGSSSKVHKVSNNSGNGLRAPFWCTWKRIGAAPFCGLRGPCGFHATQGVLEFSSHLGAVLMGSTPETKSWSSCLPSVPTWGQ